VHWNVEVNLPQKGLGKRTQRWGHLNCSTMPNFREINLLICQEATPTKEKGKGWGKVAARGVLGAKKWERMARERI